MKGTVVATAALVVLALGGTPTAAVVLGHGTSGPSGDAAPTGKTADRTQAPQPGPPVWAAGEGRAKQGAKHAGQLKGWAKNHADRVTKPAKPGKAGSRHGHAVRAWAHCVGDFNREHRGPASSGSRAAAGVCGHKPLAPGQTKEKGEKKQPRRQGPGGADGSPPAR